MDGHFDGCSSDQVEGTEEPQGPSGAEPGNGPAFIQYHECLQQKQKWTAMRNEILGGLLSGS